jgi:hypothetical protein
MGRSPNGAGRNGGPSYRSWEKVENDLVYKVVELSLVTDEEIEQQLNRWAIHGWRFDSLHFVVRENSRRPGMAFLFFVQQRRVGQGESASSAEAGEAI